MYTEQWLTWKGFSPVWTSWWRFSLELSTKALPHSAHTCTRGPWVCRCFRMAELSLNILVQPWEEDAKQTSLIQGHFTLAPTACKVTVRGLLKRASKGRLFQLSMQTRSWNFPYKSLKFKVNVHFCQNGTLQTRHKGKSQMPKLVGLITQLLSSNDHLTLNYTKLAV